MSTMQHIPMELMFAMRKRYGLEQFVETGTYHGQSAIMATSQFDTVTTCDIDPKKVNRLTGLRLPSPKRLIAICGHSPDVLRTIFASPDCKPALVWLDALDNPVAGRFDGEPTALLGYIPGAMQLIRDYADEYFVRLAGETRAVDLTAAASVSVPAATADAHALNRTTADGRFAAKTPTVTPKTDAYTLALADAGTIITVAHADAKVISVPLNATAAFPVGTIINVVRYGAGAVSVTAVDGVTLNGANEGSVSVSTRYQGVTLLKIATDEWIVSGSI
jgi:hypothetical protein